MSIAQAQKMKELERRISELEALLHETRKELGQAIADQANKRKPGRPPKHG